MTGGLKVLSIGTYLPPSRDVRELVRGAGGDPAFYNSWPRRSVAGPDDHASVMAEAALRDALHKAQLAPDMLDLVIWIGLARDYSPPYSSVSELMRACGLPARCFGLELLCGCAAAGAALETAAGWLGAHQGGAAAIVAAERFGAYVDSVRSPPFFWGWGDGAAAMIVQFGPLARGDVVYRGSVFHSEPQFRDWLTLPYHVGTREDGPQLSFKVGISSSMRDLYLTTYRALFDRILTQYSLGADTVAYLVCNQGGASYVDSMPAALGLPQGRVVRTGDMLGHLGAADVLVGVEQVLGRMPGGASCIAIGSAGYAFAASLFQAQA